MTRRSATFTQTDVKRAVRGAIEAGIEIGKVEVGRDGQITISPVTTVAAKEKED